MLGGSWQYSIRMVMDLSSSALGRKEFNWFMMTYIYKCERTDAPKKTEKKKKLVQVMAE